MLLDFIRQRFSAHRAAQRARLAVADGDSAAFLSRFGGINFELASRIDGQGLRGNGVTADELCGDLAYLLNVAGTRYGVEVDPVFGVSVREVPSLLPPPMGESAAPPAVLIKVEQGAKLQDLFE